jgi:hypothetical protein
VWETHLATVPGGEQGQGDAFHPDAAVAAQISTINFQLAQRERLDDEAANRFLTRHREKWRSRINNAEPVC